MKKEDFSKTLADSHSENYLKFVFSQAEKRLEDSCKSYEYTTTKTVVVLSVSVGLLSASLAYLFLNIDFNGIFCPRLATVVFLSLYIFFTTIILALNIFSFEYHPNGSYPEDLYVENQNGIEENLFFRKVLHEEITSYNDRINFNYDKNKARVKRLDFVVGALVFMPIFLVIFYSISTCL